MRKTSHTMLMYNADVMFAAVRPPANVGDTQVRRSITSDNDPRLAGWPPLWLIMATRGGDNSPRH